MDLGNETRSVNLMTQLAPNTNDPRSGHDRRAFSWQTVMFGFLRSRRRQHRRTADGDALFIDWHHPWLFFLATGTMLLSSLDAFLTLNLLNRGAIEVNPVMAAMLGQSVSMFAAVKMLLTGFGILVLVFLSRSRLFDRMRTGLALTAFFSFYCCLVCYEFVLLVGRL